MYKNLNARIKDLRLNFSYEHLFYNTLCNIFEYDEKLYRPDLLEYLLHKSGRVAIIKTDTAVYTPVFVDFAGGTRYADGTFSTAICFDEIGNMWQFEDWLYNPDITIVFNTPSRTPSLFVERLAYKLAEIDKSEDFNVKYSRLRPFPIARTAKEKDMILNAMRSVDTANPDVILTDVKIHDLLDGEGCEIPVLNITDVDDSEKIQYLSHFYDNVLSRFFFLCGVGMADNGKQAQISKDELNRNEYASFMLPLAWYEGRKKGFENTELTFDFSPIWKKKYDDILNGGMQDESGTDSESEVLPEDSGAIQ